jgi:SPOR domain
MLPHARAGADVRGTKEKTMRGSKLVLGLFGAFVLLSGCAPGQLARLLPATDPRIDQAPMRADTKDGARAYFNKRNPKAFAFSPEQGTYWSAWGSSSVEDAKEQAMRGCEETTRTPCVLFAVNNEIVWRPGGERVTAGTPEAGARARSVAPGEPAAGASRATEPAKARVAGSGTPLPAARFAVHVASVRDPADVPGEWRRLAGRYSSLAGLEPQAPRTVEVPGKGIFHRVIGGAFATRAEAQTVCARIRSGGGYCAVVAQEQQPYPDLEGSWVGPGRSVTQGRTDHWPDTGEAGPVFQDGSWTLVVDRQEGNRFTGAQGLTDGTRRDPVLGVIRADQRTVHMVDDDGTFLAILTGPDAMEMCRTEVTADSRLVGCRQLARQK